MPVILHFQSTGAVPGRGEPIGMQGRALTLGRGDENDFVLPDPDRLISKRHCAIEDHGGNIVIIDLSTNGTFLNYGKVPLGRVPTPLSDGDILSLGPYELLVEITEARGTAPADLPPLAAEPLSPGRADAARTADLLDDGGDDFLDDLLGGSGAPAGPAGVRRDALGEDGLLPPLGEEEGDPLAPAARPEDTGPAQAAHNPAIEDRYTLSGPAAQAIPDDWDDLLEGIAPGSGGQGGAAPGDLQDGAPRDAPGPPPAGDDLLRPAFIPPEAPAPAMPDGGALPGDAAPDPAASGAEPAARQPPAPEPATPGPAAPQPATPGPGAASPAPLPDGTAVPRPPAAPGDAAARAFLRAAGAGDLDVPDADLVATLSRMGHVLRIMVTGLREILMTRSSIKSEFRIEQTMIAAGGNNPLKFSISPEQAIEAMVRPRGTGYLDAAEAAEQALRDIKAHEIAVIAGMEAALKGVLRRLSPEELAGQIEVSGGIGSVLRGKKARYWEIYEKMYARISDEAENDFHDLFSREFVRAYKDQLERLK